MEKATLLCIDDEIDNLHALERLFRSHYKILKANSGREALKILETYQDSIALIITDQRMPEMTGVEFLSQAVIKRPKTPRILLTGYTDIESIVSAVNNGQISRYMTKPWDPMDLQSTVHQFVEKFQMSQQIEIQTRQLSLAYEELKTLDQAKTQFMSLINHELKTPLTAILSFTELLQESRLNEDQSLCVDRISKSGARLKNLIDDVLIVIGAETKTLKIKVTSFDIEKFDFNLPPNLLELKNKKNQSIAFDFVPGKWVGDNHLIRQVYLKIIHNSLKFGEENSEIKVHLKNTAPHRIQLLITNSGKNISESIKKKILTPFFIDEDIMNHSAGMGLGLTVCQSILKAHNSQLVIFNEFEKVSVGFELPSL